ncbi:MAG TPA: glycosyltransferase family 39 protein [Acidimicrobiia bacterium]|nr:glycosyltransferase family 39 protein [Acidimicrobiia bacterium]
MGERGARRAGRDRRRRFFTWLVVITLLALAWRIAFAVIFKWDQLVTGDAYFYHHQANGLVDGHGFYRFLPHSVQRLVPNGPAADHPPLYPLYLAVFSLFGGRSFHVHMIASCLLGAATVFVCGLLGREVAGGADAGERAGIVAAVVAAVYANLWIQDPLVTSESITMLMVAISVLLAYRLWRAPNLWRAVWFGVACGLASLTRAEVILFLPLVLIPLVLSKREWVAGLRPRVFAASAVVAILVMAPWLVRNLLAFDHPILVSGGGDITLASANCDATYYGPGLGWWSASCYGKDAHPTGDASDQARYWRKRAFDYIDGHLDRLPVVLLARLGRAFDVYHPGSPVGDLKAGQTLVYELLEGRDANGSSWAARLALGQYFVLAPLAIAGAFVLRRRRVTLVPLIAPIVVVCVAVLVAFGNTRYRTPAEITITVLAAVAIDAAIGCLRNRGEHTTDDDAGVPAVAEPVTVGAAVDHADPEPPDGHDD